MHHVIPSGVARMHHVIPSGVARMHSVIPSGVARRATQSRDLLFEKRKSRSLRFAIAAQSLRSG